MDAVATENQVTITDLDAELLRRDFHAFVVSAWDKVEKGTVYVDGWHIRAICEYLQALYEGSFTVKLANDERSPAPHEKPVVQRLFPRLGMD
jgi:hypothetical protein